MLRRGLIGGASAALLARAALAQVGPVGGPVGMQFPLSGPGGVGGPGPGAAAGAPPSLDLNFIDGSAFDPRITFTRSSVASYFDVTGTIQSAATNAPRIDYDPVTHAVRGLLIEEARTNLLLNSATLVTQSVTVTAQAYTLSFYGTGTVTLSGVSTAGPLVGAGAFPARAAPLTFTPTAGTLTLTVTGSVLNANLEAGSFPTSWISTAGASAARTADLATIPVAAWFNATLGTMAADIQLPSETGATAPRIMAFSDGSTANALEIFISTINITYQQTVATVANNANFGPLTTTIMRAAATYRAGAQSIVLNGGTVTSATIAGVPSGLVTLALGNRFDGVRPITGYIRRVRYWPRALSNSELQQVTS